MADESLTNDSAPPRQFAGRPGRWLPNPSAPPRVVIIGGGVSSAALGMHLHRAKLDVRVVDHPFDTDLLVGESLAPGAMKFLRRLGLEDEAKRLGTYKPGIALAMRSGETMLVYFTEQTGLGSTYAYNIPRPQFDQALKARAIADGVPFHRGHAKIEVEGDRVMLGKETLELCGLDAQPDLVIDCTGRAHLVRRALGIGGRPGKRRDTALFAHFTDVDLEAPDGFINTSVIDSGWAWRIPLQGRTSVGIITDTEHFKSYGATPEERLEHGLKKDPTMSRATARATRITRVRSYNNYQWLTDRFVGTNWIMCGDTAGFVDPALSSGVMLALEAATTLADALLAGLGDGRDHLTRWESRYRTRISSWQELVDLFYDGHLINALKQAKVIDGRIRDPIGRAINQHLSRACGSVISGNQISSRYYWSVCKFLVTHPFMGRLEEARVL